MGIFLISFLKGFRMKVEIRNAHHNELNIVHHLITFDLQWTQFNGPYFPYQSPSLIEFKEGVFKRLCEGVDMQLITIDNKPVGSVSFYWECELTRWLEMGVVLYDSTYWGKGIAYKALRLWITHLFSTLEIARVGITTWSGNKAMMSCAIKVGFTQEACLRKVRYYQGQYYDLIKYGLLRDEWETLNKI